MGIADQVFTLGGVAIGALAAFASSTLSERARYRRQLADGWRERKFDCYAAYLDDVKHMSVIARRMAASRNLEATATEPLGAVKGAALLTEAETRRTSSMEKVRLLSDGATASAAHTLNKAVWRLEWIARGRVPDATVEDWTAAVQSFLEAMNAFHVEARRELDVPGNTVPRPLDPHRPDHWVAEYEH
jgi:hypothetical protein